MYKGLDAKMEQSTDMAYPWERLSEGLGLEDMEQPKEACAVPQFV